MGGPLASGGRGPRAPRGRVLTVRITANGEPFELGGHTLLTLPRSQRFVHACLHAMLGRARPRGVRAAGGPADSTRERRQRRGADAEPRGDGGAPGPGGAGARGRTASPCVPGRGGMTDPSDGLSLGSPVTRIDARVANRRVGVTKKGPPAWRALEDGLRLEARGSAMNMAKTHVDWRGHGTLVHALRQPAGARSRMDRGGRRGRVALHQPSPSPGDRAAGGVADPLRVLAGLDPGLVGVVPVLLGARQDRRGAVALDP